MRIKPSAVILDGCVLGLLERQDCYGYELTKQVQESISISVSTLYPVLRRLKRKHFLTTYDRSYQGRNRRYYQITPAGQRQLELIRQVWQQFECGINEMLE